MAPRVDLAQQALDAHAAFLEHDRENERLRGERDAAFRKAVEAHDRDPAKGATVAYITREAKLSRSTVERIAYPDRKRYR